MIRLKRAYDPPSKQDGRRILVERLWPRGLTKEKAAVDQWLKDIAPSPQLRKWFSHDPDKWEDFCKRYRAELDENQDPVRQLKEICSAGTVTFVFAARDTERNSAIVLKAYLESSAKTGRINRRYRYGPPPEGRVSWRAFVQGRVWCFMRCSLGRL